MTPLLVFLLHASGCKKPVSQPIAYEDAAITDAAPAELAPRRALHDGVTVVFDGGMLRETSPYLEPDTDKRPVTFILHGLCAEEKWMCDWLQHGDLGPQWQICPRGPIACGNGGASWSTDTAAIVKLLERSLETTRARHPDRIRDDGVVLAGMSQGAYAIARVVHELAEHPSESLKLRGVVLQGAAVSLSSVDVKKLGLRVVLAAGEQDAAAKSMRALANSLKSQGIEARYASFGAVGHFLPVSSAFTMSELVAWARGD